MTKQSHQQKTLGAFDIRAMIALMLAIFGIILVIVGSAADAAAQKAKASGININLWTGISLIVIAALFTLWQKLRPIRVSTAPPPPSPTPPDTYK